MSRKVSGSPLRREPDDPAVRAGATDVRPAGRELLARGAADTEFPRVFGRLDLFARFYLYRA